MKIVNAIVCCLVVGGCCLITACEDDDSTHRYGYCELRPNIVTNEDGEVDESILDIGGKIRMREKLEHNGHLEMNITIHGLDPTLADGQVYLTPHQLGDLSEVCQSLGGAFQNTEDQIDVLVDEDGNFDTELVTDDWTLVGPHALIGRSFVLHRCVPGSNNCEDRISCCIIGLVNDQFW
ncbi:uncharacterized protein [Ptychodera flava]|uniref:uncharacterized protein n=1 Tax=Ptychodera flava TaxID=63121 RepID=UPI00396A38AE